MPNRLDEGSRVGYLHNEGYVSGDSNWSLEKKALWRKFEDIRLELYKTYQDMVKDQPKLDNHLLAACLRNEITFRETSENIEEVLTQWIDVINRYTKEERQAPLRQALLEVVNRNSQEPEIDT